MRNRHHSGCQTQAQGTGWTEGTSLVSLSSSSVSEPEQQSEKGPRVLRISSFTELSSRGTASICGVLSNTPPPVPKVRQTGHAHFRYKDFTRLRPHHTVALWTQRNHPARGAQLAGATQAAMPMGWVIVALPAPGTSVQIARTRLTTSMTTVPTAQRKPPQSTEPARARQLLEVSAGTLGRRGLQQAPPEPSPEPPQESGHGVYPSSSH